jgi:hypothetical protein
MSGSYNACEDADRTFETSADPDDLVETLLPSPCFGGRVIFIKTFEPGMQPCAPLVLADELVTPLISPVFASSE